MMWVYANEERTEALNVETGAYINLDCPLPDGRASAVCEIAGEEYRILGEENIKRLRQKIGARVADLES